jgi:hypothetical protein
MPVIFGDVQDNGKIKVGCIQWQMKSDPNRVGIAVDAVPEYPKTLTRGKDNVMYFEPKTKQFSFEQEDRPLTQEESLQAGFESLAQKLDKVIELLSKK